MTQRAYLFLRNTCVPLALMICCPIAVILLWYANFVLEGSISMLIYQVKSMGFLKFMSLAWLPIFWGSREAWLMIVAFSITQLIFMKILPGKHVYGPTTATGFTPKYKDNGLLAFIVSILLYVFCSQQLMLFSPTIIYDHFGELLSALNVFSLFFCLFLYLKGRFFPSPGEHSLTSNFVFDYYWGVELYPRVLGFDVKQFTNCRFGMMSWGLIIISFLYKQVALYGLNTALLCSVVLQLIYIAKFFLWESGYMRSLDIMHDRAGFYICWGCLVWVPGFYTLPAAFLVHYTPSNHLILNVFIFCCGALAISINFLADRQRQVFRRKKGDILIFGKEPVINKAKYYSSDNEEKVSLLLASGFWGIARHFNYLPEILGALFWSLPALFSGIVPYFYVIFLTILLLHRLQRDEKRCEVKYGKYWTKQCSLVPYKLIPFVY